MTRATKHVRVIADRCKYVSISTQVACKIHRMALRCTVSPLGSNAYALPALVSAWRDEQHWKTVQLLGALSDPHCRREYWNTPFASHGSSLSFKRTVLIGRLHVIAILGYTAILLICLFVLAKRRWPGLTLGSWVSQAARAKLQ